jgi:nicotinamide-nucleotide amidase
LKYASILSIGSEILDGRVQDSNAQYLCELLKENSISVKNIISCDDNLEEIIEAIEFAKKSIDYLIVSGGLGPTTDDLTREAIAKYCKVELELDNESLEKIKEIFRKRNRPFIECNQLQAMFPKGSQVIENSNGTAPGFHISSDTKLQIFCLPGVPSELKPMFESYVLPIIVKENTNQSKIQKIAFKIFGLPESLINEKVTALQLPSNIKISYRAKFPEIHLKLESSDIPLNDIAESIQLAIGTQNIFSHDLKETLESCAFKLLQKNNISISGTESCTGGMISTLLTSLPGISKNFIGCLIAYSNKIKNLNLGVTEETLYTHGAVSAETAKEMAINARHYFNSDIAYSVTGVAGPDGGTSEKPVGLFYIGFSDKDCAYSIKFFLPSDRERIRRYASYMTLDVIRRYLLGVVQHTDAKMN